jgi:hypothetical protein
MSAVLRQCKTCGENITGKPRYQCNQTGDYHCQNHVPDADLRAVFLKEVERRQTADARCRHLQQQLMQAQPLASTHPAQELAHSDLEKEKAEHMKTQKKLDEMTVKFENADTHYVAMWAFFKEHLDKDQACRMGQPTRDHQDIEG